MASIGDGESVRRFTLSLNVLPAHAEDHRRSSAVLNGRVTTELEQVGDRQHLSDVVAVCLHVADDLHSDIQLRVVRPLQLRVESQDAPRATANVRILKYLRDFRAHHSARIVKSRSKQMCHVRLAVEDVEERFLRYVVQIHDCR